MIHLGEVQGAASSSCQQQLHHAEHSCRQAKSHHNHNQKQPQNPLHTQFLGASRDTETWKQNHSKALQQPLQIVVLHPEPGELEDDLLWIMQYAAVWQSALHLRIMLEIITIPSTSLLGKNNQKFTPRK